VQGPFAVEEVTAALQTLDADQAVDVIVIACGGGSIEDLLPFSDETLVRAVAACRRPLTRPSSWSRCLGGLVAEPLGNIDSTPVPAGRYPVIAPWKGKTGSAHAAGRR
jgi:hypothetical protein